MSRREGRDSDSKRRHSRFDREPSPKRSRRDGKHERERDRVISSANLDKGNHTDRDHKYHQQQPVASPLEAPLAHDSKQEARGVNKDSDKKPNDHNEAPKRSSNPTEVPRSRSYFQHDERGIAGQVGRSSARMETGERGWWKDSKDHLTEKAEISHSREQREEKSLTKPDDNTSQRKDGLSERKYDLPPTTKRRPAFREKKIPVQEDANPAATETVKSSQTDHPLERNERRGERSYNPRHSDRPEKQNAGERAPYKSEAGRDVFSPRGRYNNNNYRGRDKFNGREGFGPSKTGMDKWKHDLYQEVNKDPIPKNEDDQIAKLEALLAS